MLFEVVQSGTGRAAALRGREVAGKTGTSADYRDAWFVGYSPELVAGVWVGNDDSMPTKRVTGGGLPAQIWGSFMVTALKGQRPTPLPRAEPLYEPLIAEAEDEAVSDGFFDRVGRLLDRIIGERRAPLPEPARPQAREPEPRYGAQQDDPRDRYAYQPRNVDPEPRRGYNDPRDRPRYGYGGYYQEPRRDRDPRYYDPRYR
jgi:membrane peptidoglycan carboxypeptidase